MADQPAPQPTLAQVVEELKIIHSRLHEGKKVTDNLTTQVASVHKMYENLASQVTLLNKHLDRQVPTQGHNQAKKQQLPTPSTFDGTKWETWEPYARAKLQTDGTAIGDSRAQFWYLYGCLNASAQSTVLHLAANGDPQDILTTLGRIYEDPNKAAKAAGKLTKLSQFNDEVFSAYLARFERTLLQAGAQEWPDLAKISALRAGLGKDLKDKLKVQLSLPSTYDSFVKACHQLTHGGNGNSNGGNTNFKKEYHKPEQLAQITAINTVTNTANNRGGRSLIPMSQLLGKAVLEDSDEDTSDDGRANDEYVTSDDDEF